MAATGVIVIIGAASPQLCLQCQVVSGIVRIASRVTRPLHSTFPAGNGARAHGLRAEAGAPFLSFNQPLHCVALAAHEHTGRTLQNEDTGHAL